MKIIVILSILVAGILTETNCYSTAHDDLDVETIVANKETLQSFLDCFTDKKPCNDLTLDFKKNLPQVIQEACANCNPTQKRKLKIFLDGMNEKLPKEFAEFKKSFDPNGKLFPALDAALAKPQMTSTGIKVN